MARRGEHSKYEIKAMALAQARALIEQGGLSSVSARKVAGDIGYTVGSLYMVFDNLDDLILHVNASTLDELYGQLQQNIREDDAASVTLKKLAHTYIDFALANPNCWNAVFEHNVAGSTQHPEWFQRRVDAMFSLVEQYTSEINANHTQAVKAARVLWCGVHGICVLYMTNKLHLPDQVELRVLVEDLVDNYLTGWSKGIEE